MEIESSMHAPLDAAGLLGFLARRAVPGVEEVRGCVYRRSLRTSGGGTVLELRIEPERVAVRADAERSEVEPAARAICDLDTDPLPIARRLGADPLLAPLVAASPGRRVPGHPDPGELAIRAVIGQQVSVAAARTVSARLVHEAGEPLRRPAGSVTHLFPEPRALAAIGPEDLPMPRRRARTLTGLARALAAGALALDRADRDAAARLESLPGIGPWTVVYVRMRGLGDRDAFAAGDLGVRRALERLGVAATPAAATARAERWRPYRAYAQQHLWATL